MPFTATNYLPYDFANRRHIGPSPAEMAEMFEVLAVDSLDQLIDETVPKSIRQEAPLDFGKPKSESELLHHMWQTASKNKVLTSLIGQGYHSTVTPPAIQRNIFENPAWYTAYTPYQPEISQGRLEALLNFQTMVSDLTGLEISNASLLDEATAAAEAMTMAQRVAKSKARAFFIDENCHPQNIAVMQTRAAPLDIEVIVGAPEQLEADKVFGAIFQYPGTHGHLRDFSAEIAALHEHKGIGIVIADPLALTLLKEPGAMGADIAVGSTQRFGVPIGYGGPHAAYMACADARPAGPPRRRFGRCARQQGVSPRAPDPRAAHPPREGDLERLHRPGASRRHGLVLCRFPWARGAEGHRAAHSPQGRAARAGARGGRLHRRAAVLLRHIHRRGRRASGRDHGSGPPRAHQLPPRRQDEDRHRARRDGPPRYPRSGLARLRSLLFARRVPRWLHPPARAPLPGVRLPHAPDLPSQPCRDRDDALHAPARRPRSRPRPRDDPAWLLHDEAQRGRRDDADHLARVRQHPPLRALGPSARLHGIADRPLRHPVPDNRLRRDVDAAQFRCPGRIRGASHHCRLPPRQWPPRAAGLPHPHLRPRHQPGLRTDGGHGGRHRQGGRKRRYRRRRLSRQGRSRWRPARGLHDHLSLDPRGLRGDRARGLRDHPSPRRAGLSRRGEPQRARRTREARRDRGGRLAPEPPQDLLHPPRRRGSRHGADRREGASRAVPARPSRGRRHGGTGVGGSLRVGLDPADLLGLLPDDGRRGADAGDPRRHPQRQLHRQEARRRL